MKNDLPACPICERTDLPLGHQGHCSELCEARAGALRVVADNAALRTVAENLVHGVDFYDQRRQPFNPNDSCVRAAVDALKQDSPGKELLKELDDLRKTRESEIKLRQALQFIQHRTVGSVPEMESPAGNRLQRIWCIADLALANEDFVSRAPPEKWLVVICRDGDPRATTVQMETNIELAQSLFDQLSLQWSDSFLAKVVMTNAQTVPRQWVPRGDLIKLEARVAELEAEVASLRELPSPVAQGQDFPNGVDVGDHSALLMAYGDLQKTHGKTLEENVRLATENEAMRTELRTKLYQALEPEEPKGRFGITPEEWTAIEEHERRHLAEGMPRNHITLLKNVVESLSGMLFTKSAAGDYVLKRLAFLERALRQRSKDIGEFHTVVEAAQILRDAGLGRKPGGASIYNMAEEVADLLGRHSRVVNVYRDAFARAKGVSYDMVERIDEEAKRLA